MPQKTYSRPDGDTRRPVPLRVSDALLDLLADLTDPDDCTYDHHGYCQAHMWFEVDPPCPHARAKKILAAHIRNAGGT